MSNEGSVSRGGVAANHGTRVSLPIVVSVTDGTQFNTVRPSLLPIACWRLEDLRFEFDSSFVLPEAADEFTSLSRLWLAAGKPPCSVFGHADPVGNDAYNKTLSGRRARAIQAVLLRNTDEWEDMYSHPEGGDQWGSSQQRAMLQALGYASNGVHGVSGAAKAFQGDEGLQQDGVIGPITRKRLFEKYMDVLCKQQDGTPFKLSQEDFLARGKDPNGKGDRQGCGEFNPILLFAASENSRLSAPQNHAERNVANAPNRRVVVFMFPPGTQVDPSKWPCPSVKDSADGCRAQFWPDGDARRTPTEKQRTQNDDHNTFACRFYDGMARRSPCEMTRKTLRMRVHDAWGNAMSGATYRVRIGSYDVRTGKANENAWLVEHDVMAPSRVFVEWSSEEYLSTHEVYECQRLIYLDFDKEGMAPTDSARKRLHNLGYSPGETLGSALELFQKNYGLPVTGELDAATQERLEQAHDSGVAEPEQGGAVT